MSFILLSLLCVSAFATDNQSNGTSYLYTAEDLIILKEKDRLADEMYNSYKDKISDSSISLFVMPLTITYTIPVTVYTQQTYSWCGPASLQQTLSFHKSQSGSSTALPSQSTIASKLGISSTGAASSTSIASVLNQYKGTFGYSNRTYSTANVADKSNAFEWLYSNLRSEIVNQTYAPIILIQTGELSGIRRYYDAGVFCRHYNTVSGIRETVDLQNDNLMSREIQTSDPHYNAQFRGKFWDEASAIYQSMLLADNNGSNYVLVY